MNAEKREKLQRELARQSERARETGGCLICFKPFDPFAPGCNGHECEARWRAESAKRATPGDDHAL